MTQSRYYSKTGCDGMGRNVWNMKWGVPGQETDQRKVGQRLWKKTARHVN